MPLYKAFRHVETLFVQGRNLYLSSLLLDAQGLFTFRQPIARLQGTDFYLGLIVSAIEKINRNPHNYVMRIPGNICYIYF